MDEKVKNDEKKVMLVRQTGEGQDGKLKAVGSIDEDGNIKTLDPTAANVPNCSTCTRINLLWRRFSPNSWSSRKTL